MAAFDHNGLPGSALDRELRGLNCARCDRLSCDLAAAQEELERVRDKCNEHYLAMVQAQEAIKAAEAHEAETHRTLGSILGTDDSLEQCAKRLLERAQRAEALTEKIKQILLPDPHDEREVSAEWQVKAIRAAIDAAMEGK